MRARFVAGASLSYDDAGPGLAARVRAALRQEPMTAGALATLAHKLACAHVKVLRELARASAAPMAIAMHGQTLYHAPPVSLQLCAPWPVAEALGVPVLHDLRGADLAAGGQGAPLTPTSDFIMYAGAAPTAVVNLGGFANATVLPPRGGDPSTVRGFDICLCNQLLDELARTRLGQPCDWAGAAATGGTIDPAAGRALVSLLTEQANAGRSLGTADESVAAAASMLAQLGPEDACATAVSAIAGTIFERLGNHQIRHLVLAGGGVLNLALEAALRGASPGGPSTTAAQWPAAFREAAAMAILGALALDGIAPGLPAVTGRRNLAGCCSTTILP
jgi:anhydro-N-acetylmuramic acid kinase